jgi:TolA-binding protein
VIADTKAWEKDYGNEPLLGEVLALQADSYAAKGDDDQAVPLYIRSYKAATSDEILNYSITAAQKLLQKKGQWDKIGQMWQEFVEKNPEHPMLITAVYYIGKARVREGKVDEAKQFIADTVKKYIADPKRDAVEQLLTQLAQLCTRKKAPAAVAAASPAAGAEPGASAIPAAVAEASPVAAATPAVDPGAELDKLLSGPEIEQSPTAKARVLFAKSELARLRKQTADMEKNLQAIADKFKPEDLSPMLLAQIGDFLLEKKQLDKAEPIFKYLMDEYPKSDVLDFAYNGLGEVAYQKKDYQRALKLFTDAVEKVGAQQKLRDVTVGRAKTLLAMDRLDDAKKLFEQIASVREWRGEATAFAVFSLGEIAEKKNDLAGAIANYQRVYVAYQRFLPWVAKAYIKSAECFEKLNKTQEAQNTYREMLRNDKLANFPETQLARKRVQEAG